MAFCSNKTHRVTECSCPATKQSTQQEWQSYTPLTCSPTTASPEKLSPIGILASPQTSPEKGAVCWASSRTFQQPTTLRRMVRASEQISPWNSTCDSTVEHTKKTGRHGYHWPSTPGTPGPT